MQSVSNNSVNSSEKQSSFPNDDNLRSVEEIPKEYRHVFPNIRYFNIIQSKVLDYVYYTDQPIVVSSPTGSGKTVIFELAIIRFLINMECTMQDDYKMVYISPLKALCEERLIDWNKKFYVLGVRCISVTGDNDEYDCHNLINFNLIITTPEKWDSLTRRWRNEKHFVQKVKLFMIDEVHLLNEEGRGPTLEAVVNRMKIIEDIGRYGNNSNINPFTNLRFIAVSATIPNAEDVAEWIGNSTMPAKHFQFGEEMRPVPLKKLVFSYPEQNSPFRFDLSLNYKLPSVILQHSEGKPTIIFCSTRKSVEMTTQHLLLNLTVNLSQLQKQTILEACSAIEEQKLREALVNGVGCHHAGFSVKSRRTVEELFRKGNLGVLVTTSTLALGVNLPAHLVIVKSTKYYIGGEYKDYGEGMVLQMIGRAGRPQFDNSGTAVIMTTTSDKHKYENMVGGKLCIESNLHKHLTEHVNAEVVLKTITDLSVAMQWIASTFLYVRARKNPKHYGLPLGLTTSQTEQKLLEMCQIEINKLAKAGMLCIDQEDISITPLMTGSLMAKYYIAFDTMKLFTKMSGKEALQQVLGILSKCKEFCDIRLRVGEKKTLNLLNKDSKTECIRFPMNGRIKTTDMKINCIIQAVFGCLQITEASLLTESQKIMRTGERLSKCLTEYLQTKENCYSALLSALTLAKCFHTKLWEDSAFVSRQLPGIGPVLSSALVTAGKTSFQSLLEANPRDLERIMNRKPPFGNTIQDKAKYLPTYELSMQKRENQNDVLITVVVTLTNVEGLKILSTVNLNSFMNLLVGNPLENTIYLYEKYTHSHFLDSPRLEKVITVPKSVDTETIAANLISNDWVGIDKFSAITLSQTFVKGNKFTTQQKIRKTINSTKTATSATTPKNKSHIQTFLDTFFPKRKHETLNKMKKMNSATRTDNKQTEQATNSEENNALQEKSVDNSNDFNKDNVDYFSKKNISIQESTVSSGPPKQTEKTEESFTSKNSSIERMLKNSMKANNDIFNEFVKHFEEKEINNDMPSYSGQIDGNYGQMRTRVTQQTHFNAQETKNTDGSGNILNEINDKPVGEIKSNIFTGESTGHQSNKPSLTRRISGISLTEQERSLKGSPQQQENFLKANTSESASQPSSSLQILNGNRLFSWNRKPSYSQGRWSSIKRKPLKFKRINDPGRNRKTPSALQKNMDFEDRFIYGIRPSGHSQLSEVLDPCRQLPKEKVTRSFTTNEKLEVLPDSTYNELAAENYYVAEILEPKHNNFSDTTTSKETSYSSANARNNSKSISWKSPLVSSPTMKFSPKHTTPSRYEQQSLESLSSNFNETKEDGGHQASIDGSMRNQEVSNTSIQSNNSSINTTLPGISKNIKSLPQRTSLKSKTLTSNLEYPLSDSDWAKVHPPEESRLTTTPEILSLSSFVSDSLLEMILPSTSSQAVGYSVRRQEKNSTTQTSPYNEDNNSQNSSKKCNFENSPRLSLAPTKTDENPEKRVKIDHPPTPYHKLLSPRERNNADNTEKEIYNRDVYDQPPTSVFNEDFENTIGDLTFVSGSPRSKVSGMRYNIEDSCEFNQNRCFQCNNYFSSTQLNDGPTCCNSTESERYNTYRRPTTDESQRKNYCYMQQHTSDDDSRGVQTQLHERYSQIRPANNKMVLGKNYILDQTELNQPHPCIWDEKTRFKDTPTKENYPFTLTSSRPEVFEDRKTERCEATPTKGNYPFTISSRPEVFESKNTERLEEPPIRRNYSFTATSSRPEVFEGRKTERFEATPTKGNYPCTISSRPEVFEIENSERLEELPIRRNNSFTTTLPRPEDFEDRERERFEVTSTKGNYPFTTSSRPETEHLEHLPTRGNYSFTTTSSRPEMFDNRKTKRFEDAPINENYPFTTTSSKPEVFENRKTKRFEDISIKGNYPLTTTSWRPEVFENRKTKRFEDTSLKGNYPFTTTSLRQENRNTECFEEEQTERNYPFATTSSRPKVFENRKTECFEDAPTKRNYSFITTSSKPEVSGSRNFCSDKCCRSVRGEVSDNFVPLRIDNSTRYQQQEYNYTRFNAGYVKNYPYISQHPKYYSSGSYYGYNKHSEPFHFQERLHPSSYDQYPDCCSRSTNVCGRITRKGLIPETVTSRGQREMDAFYSETNERKKQLCSSQLRGYQSDEFVPLSKSSQSPRNLDDHQYEFDKRYLSKRHLDNEPNE